MFVSDEANRTIKVFLGGKLITNYLAQSLRLIEVSALAVDEDVLYIADDPASKALPRIQSP